MRKKKITCMILVSFADIETIGPIGLTGPTCHLEGLPMRLLKALGFLSRPKSKFQVWGIGVVLRGKNRPNTLNNSYSIFKLT